MKKFRLVKNITMIFSLALISILLLANDGLAKVKIVTSTTDFAALARDIGGDKVEVTSLAKGYQDPHFVDAKPIFVTRLNQADLLIYNGLEQEIGWLPILITGARNSDISAANSIGHYDASTSIKTKLEITQGPIDRSMGDVHPGGNPHYMLNPNNAAAVARSIAARLIRIDPENAAYYEENFKNFTSSLKQKISEWTTELAPFQGTKVVTYHKLWIYFTNWAGFKEVGTIEPKPGISPSPAHIASIIKTIEQDEVKLIISANYYPQKTPSIIAEKTGVPFLSLPVMVGGQDGINSYIELFDVLVAEITSTLNNTIKTGNGS